MLGEADRESEIRHTCPAANIDRSSRKLLKEGSLGMFFVGDGYFWSSELPSVVVSLNRNRLQPVSWYECSAVRPDSFELSVVTA
jgi:hypothetical protein